jgi:predicted TIM-barrel fold metal-dependent hydrolase
VESHLAFMERQNIVGSAVSVSSPHLHFSDPGAARELARLVNEEGADMVRKHPGKFALLASLPLANVQDSVDEVNHARDALHAAGFTLPTNARGMYVTSSFLEPVFEAINAKGGVVTFHPNKPGAVPLEVGRNLPMPMMEFFFDTTRIVVDLLLNDYIGRYPNIQFLIPHCGALSLYVVDRLIMAANLLAFLGMVKEGFDPKASFSALYFDVAGNAVPHQLKDAMDYVPFDHFTYGSDFPFTPEREINLLGAKLSDAPYLSDTQREDIFYSNGKKLFPSLGE